MISSENSLTIALVLVMVTALGITLESANTDQFLGDQVHAQQQQQQQRQQHMTQASILHNAKGHESHQVVNLQNATEGSAYSGTVIFNSSKPVDIMAFEDVTGKNTNSTVKIWEVDAKKYATKTLATNATQGTLDYQGAGLVTHSTSSEPYAVTFKISSMPMTNIQ
jgi:hypothetical protein